MREFNYKALAKEFYSMVKDTTPETAVKVEVTRYSGKDNGINIIPAKTNTRGNFYHVTEMVDFCRFKKLSCYITHHEGVCVARMY